MFLGAHLEGVLRLEAAAGETAFLPGGWLAAAAVLQDSVALGGCWLQAGALDVQLPAWQLEVRDPALCPRTPGFREPDDTELNVWKLEVRPRPCAL